jgi:hypothetical protein
MARIYVYVRRTTLFELQKLKNLNNTGRNKQNESTKTPSLPSITFQSTAQVFR